MTEHDRLENLEIKIAHLERGLQELSDVVVRQQQELERVLLRNQQLTQDVESLRADSDAATRVERPPHY